MLCICYKRGVELADRERPHIAHFWTNEAAHWNMPRLFPHNALQRARASERKHSGASVLPPMSQVILFCLSHTGPYTQWLHHSCLGWEKQTGKVSKKDDRGGWILSVLVWSKGLEGGKSEWALSFSHEGKIGALPTTDYTNARRRKPMHDCARAEWFAKLWWYFSIFRQESVWCYTPHWWEHLFFEQML